MGLNSRRMHYAVSGLWLLSMKAIQRWPSCAGKGKSHPCQSQSQALQLCSKTNRAAGAKIAARKFMMIVTSHPVAMLCWPWKTATLPFDVCSNQYSSNADSAAEIHCHELSHSFGCEPGRPFRFSGDFKPSRLQLQS